MLLPRKLGHQVMLLTIGSVLLLALALLGFTLQENQQHSNAAEQEALRIQLHHIESVIHNTSHETLLAATLVAQRPDVVAAVAKHDWQALAALFDPLWPSIKAHGIAQLHFQIPPATSLYRVHKPQSHGDDLSTTRLTVVEAIRSGKPVGGLETGQGGTGIRGVVPVIQGSSVVGSAEFGRALDDSLFAGLLDSDSRLAIYLIDGGQRVPLTGNSLLPMPADSYATELAGKLRLTSQEQGGRHYMVLTTALKDFSGKSVGIIELARDHSSVAAALASQAWNMILITLFGAGLIALVMALLLAKLTRPLLGSIQALEALANGSGDLGSRLPVTGTDETRRLGLAFNSFVAKIRSTISQLSSHLVDLASESEHLAHSATSSLSSMTRQQEQTTMLATAMTEMTTTVHDVAHNTAQAADAAGEADQQATTGDAVVQRSVQLIEQLSGEITHAGETVQEVAKASEQIGSVLAVIQSIAEQTNLLALNAAIEAARAGEQGRGFAVVADEVRSLAARTQDSTAEIRHTIEQLQETVHSSVALIERSVSRAGESVHSATQAGETLGNIKVAVNRIREMNDQIATASEEQSSVSDEITRSIVNVHEISQATTQEARNTAQSAAHVANLIDKLGDLASQFHDSSNMRMVLGRARAAHLGWKSRMRAFLDGQSVLTQSEAVSERNCRLGHWYFGEGQACCNNHPAFTAMAAPHARLHQVIQQIISLKSQGRQTEAENLYNEVERNSSQVVECIDRLVTELAASEETAGATARR